MRAVFRYLVALLLLILGWKAASLILSSAMVPAPEKALAAFGQAIKTKHFWYHFSASGLRVAAAMSLAWLIAFPAGVALGYFRRIDEVLSPIVFLTYPIPKIVLLPVFLVVFGLGDFSKIFMIGLIIGFQVLVAVRDAVLLLDKKYVDSFRSLGGRGLATLRHVIVPAALPNGFTAMRIGTGTGIAVLFFVESFATVRGLGFFIMDSWGRFAYEQMFVGILGMSLLGVILYETFNYLEKRVCAWKYVETGRMKSSNRPLAFVGHIQTFGRMIKFSHTVFALPFALAAVVLAQREYPLTLGLIFWILVAMVGARSAAMGFNRIVDARFDRQNPRTAGRELPAGVLSKTSATLFVTAFGALFVLAAAMISKLCLILSVPVLLVLFFYSYTKRFTAFSHIYLGFSISLAPMGAWIAVTGGFDLAIATVSLALLTYIAGFDILYACQDVDFDREIGLFSMPANWGVNKAMHIATLLHVVSFACFVAIFIVFDLGSVYMVALVLIGALLIWEHQLVKPHDLTHIQTAFFNINSYISVILFVGILGDELVRLWV
jgi:4-hydroxybenzoate polyprenyltransferase